MSLHRRRKGVSWKDGRKAFRVTYRHPIDAEECSTRDHLDPWSALDEAMERTLEADGPRED
jgi:hypothetical protein